MTMLCRHSIGNRPARPLSGSLSGRSRRKPRLPPISDKLDLAMEGSHHQIFWVEDGVQGNEEMSSSSEEMEEEEPVKEDESNEDDVIRKPASEDSTPEEDDDIFARSSKSGWRN